MKVKLNETQRVELLRKIIEVEETHPTLRSSDNPLPQKRGRERLIFVIQWLCEFIPPPRILGIPVPRWIWQAFLKTSTAGLIGFIGRIVQNWNKGYGRGWVHANRQRLMATASMVK